MDRERGDLLRPRGDRATRRSFARLLGGLTLAAPLAAPLQSEVAGKRRKRRRKKRRKTGPARKIVTKTFTNPAPIVIPAGAPGVTMGQASPYPSVMNVAGFANGRILDVNVTLHGFTHTQPNDVDVLLVATHLPGNDALIVSDTGGDTDVTALTVTLDDQAASLLSIPLVSGTFKPNNNGASDPFPAPANPTGNVSLSVFNNGNPNGTWQLFVADDFTSDSGSIAGGWSLAITAEVDA